MLMAQDMWVVPAIALVPILAHTTNQGAASSVEQVRRLHDPRRFPPAAKRDVATFTHVRYASNMEPRSSFEAVQELLANAAITGAHMHLCHINSTLLKLDKRNYSQEKTHETKQRNTTGIC